MLQVFISYSWKNQLHRDALIGRIRNAQHEPLWDQSCIPLGEGLNQGIIDMLNRADAAIAYLSPESIESHAVREELARAHHQGLHILPIVHRTVVSQLPWYLQAPMSLHYETEAELATAFDRAVDLLSSDHDFIKRAEIHRFIQDQHHYASEIVKRSKIRRPEGRYALELAGVILGNSLAELKSLTTSHYRATVGDGANFLMRAKSVFENADQVYAVSIDSVSSFWVSRKTLDQRRARDYLATQPSNTMRLFVFSSAESTHNYVTMLNIHARKYGTDGRVFLCSKPAYKKIVNECTTYDDSHGMFTCDFAVLEYQNTYGVSIVKATFDGESFNVTNITRNNTFPILKEDEVRRVFQELKRIEPGAIDPTYGVMRWDIDLQKREEVWANRLDQLFGDRDPDVFHLVFFSELALSDNTAKAELRARISDVMFLLAEVRDDEDHPIRLKHAWFGEYDNLQAHDNYTGGRLSNEEASAFPYVLLMQFENRRSLQEWYALGRHSEVRRNLYKAFDSKFRDLFEAIDKISETNPRGVHIATMYEEIERQASDFLTRRDYRQADTTRDIVSTKPFRPNIHFP